MMQIINLKKAIVINWTQGNGLYDYSKETKVVKVSETLQLSTDEMRLCIVDVATVQGGMVSWWGPIDVIRVDINPSMIDSIQKLN